MASFFSFLIRKKIPSRTTLKEILSGHLTVQTFCIYALFVLFLGTIYLTLITLNRGTLVSRPAAGGALSEGIIGTPQFINPILATTQTDRALTGLLYSGLMKYQSDGTLIPSLAETYDISPDGLSYTFILRSDLRFSDNKPFTSADVTATIALLQNSLINTATHAAWQNLSVDTPDPHTVIINLPTPDSELLSKLTVGILPAHIWTDLDPEKFIARALTKKPVGISPFSVRSISRSDDAIKKIVLARRSSHTPAHATLDRLTIRSYPNQTELRKALEDKDIDITVALGSEQIQHLDTDTVSIIPVPTQDTVALYRYTNESILGNATLLNVLTQFIDKNTIADTVEHGYGAQASDAETLSGEAATALLTSGGYTLSNGTLMRGGSPVILSIAAENTPRALESAEALTGELLKLGITVSVRAFDPGTLQGLIQNGTYGIILVTNNQPLPRSYRVALPLYTTPLPYIISSSAHGITPSVIASPPLRYANVTDWYTNTDRLWPWVDRLVN